ncbi:hypothetical protein GRX01_01915 [Halobaculum sp. WSA2]|uniref:site-specific DNA-methyltransferase (adenine-specific) n=1 Tax=Halobaculum saliterrae TaxID=2073113 RepID=A0A6B0SN05_9EURY|nr:hypothetical protein [Halobaculum saliterrae]MXR40115.1 hypothetical protein [Halobaculum saliterrae]
MSDTPYGSYGAGFVERVVEAADGVEATLDADAGAEQVAASLCAALFGDVLGHDPAAYELDGRVARVRDGDGAVAVTFAAVGRDAADAGAAVVAAFEAASDEPTARYVVAGGVDRLLVFERVGDGAVHVDDTDGDAGGDGVDRETVDGEDMRTVAGVTAVTHAEIPLARIVAAGRQGRLSQTLRPGQQLAVAKLTALRAGELSAVGAGDPDGTPTDREDDGTASEHEATDDGPGAIAETLRDRLDDLLAPAVEAAHARLVDDLDGYDDRAADLREEVRDARRGDGDETAAGPARRRLLAHECAHAGARALRAAYGTWVRGAGRTGFTPSENRRAFARVVAFQLVEEALLDRTLAGAGVLDATLTGDALGRLTAFADDVGVDRDAGDLFALARERRATVYDRRAPDLAGWALDDDGVREALSRTVDALDVALADLDGEPDPESDPDPNPTRAATAYDRLLSAADLPGVDTDPHGADRNPAAPDPLSDPLPDALLDAAGYLDSVAGADTAVGEPTDLGGDLLDPAVGDGRYLLAAAARLRSELADVDPAERLRAVRERLTGASPDPLACRVTETRLLLQLLDDYRAARQEGDGFTLDSLPVYRTDPLIRDEHDPAALAREDYDYVVGAPPATLRRDVADGPVADAYAGYETAYYTYDTSALYVERASEWLAENGTLALRVAGRFRDTRCGEKLRERLPQWYRLEELREVPGEAAGGTPVLLVARRFRRNEPFTDPEEYEPPTYGFTYAEGLDDEGVRRSSSRLTAEHWDWDADGDDDEIGI